jgi:hypothetical protein
MSNFLPMRAVGVVRGRQRVKDGASITPNSGAKIETKILMAQQKKWVLN